MEKCGNVGRQFVAFGAVGRSGAGFCQANGGGWGIAALHACSACSGDYEDPERTAWPADEEAEDERENAEAAAAAAEEFPAESE